MTCVDRLAQLLRGRAGGERRAGFPRVVDGVFEVVHWTNRTGREALAKGDILPCRGRPAPRDRSEGRGGPRLRQPGARYIDLKRCANVRLTVSFSARLAQHDHGLAAPVAIDAGDRAQIHDRAAVDLPERLGIELLVELLDRLPDQRLTVAR